MKTKKVVFSFSLRNFDPNQKDYAVLLLRMVSKIKFATERPETSDEPGEKVDLMKSGAGAVSFNNAIADLRSQGFFLVKAYRIAHTVNFEFLQDIPEDLALVKIFKELIEESGWSATQFNNPNGSVVIVAGNVINQEDKTRRKHLKDGTYKAPQAKIVVKKQFTMFIAERRDGYKFFNYREIHPNEGVDEEERLIEDFVALLISDPQGTKISSTIVLPDGKRFKLLDSDVSIPLCLRIMDFEKQVVDLIADGKIPADTQFWVM